MRDAAGSEVIVIPDAGRFLTGAFGVSVWPTTIVVDERGIVASVTTGRHPEEEVVPAGVWASGGQECLPEEREPGRQTESTMRRKPC